MSVAKTIRARVLRIRLAEPFTNKQFLKLSSRASVDKALSRLVSEGVIQRIIRGLFMRPQTNRYIGMVAPGVRKVVEVMAKDRGEIIQVQGAVQSVVSSCPPRYPCSQFLYQRGKSGVQDWQPDSSSQACQLPEASVGWQDIWNGSFCFAVSGEKQREIRRCQNCSCPCACQKRTSRN